MREAPVFFVLRHLNQQYVALDSASGGYPYLVPEFKRAEFFDSFEAAFKYKGIFASNNGWESDKWRIVRCEVAETVISLQAHLTEDQ